MKCSGKIPLKLKEMMVKEEHDARNDGKAKKIRRREFIASGLGLGAAGLACAGLAVGLAKSMIPTVTYRTPLKFRLKTKDLPTRGNELVFDEQRVILIRREDGKLAAISLICTHLGCTVYRVVTGFQCPCHGSQYDQESQVVGGPAPRGLAWLPIRNVPGGEIEIDAGEEVGKNTYYEIV